MSKPAESILAQARVVTTASATGGWIDTLIRDMQLWWLMSNGQWVRGSYTASPGGYMYHSSWRGEQTTSENAFRDESNNGGGKSARYVNMNAPSSSSLQFDEWHWHFFGPRATVPSGYVGFATAYFVGGVRIFVCEAYHDDKESVCQANRRGPVGPQKYLI